MSLTQEEVLAAVVRSARGMYTHVFVRGRVFALVCAMLAGAACQVDSGRDISSDAPYADMIGARYTVVADYLDAYGVYESLNDRIVTSIDLISLRPGISGSEIAFRRNVPQGATIRILSAWKRRVLFESGISYRVEVEGLDLAPGVPIEVKLFRGNEGGGANLNPGVFKRLPKEN